MNTRKSFKNWIDKWRPKVENQYSGDFVYLLPDGRPLNSTFRKNLIIKAKEVWKDFHPYVFRDWCAIARLISNDFNVYEVFDWFEHSELSVTEYYIKDSKKYHKMNPCDWIRSVLKFHKKEENRLKSKRAKKTLVSTGNSPREKYGPTGIRTPVTGSEGRKDIQTTS